MTCPDCEAAGSLAYYRWKHANIAMLGCDEHLREVFAALNVARAKEASA